jgi:hypothetical protein
MPLDTKVRWKGGTLGILILTALVHNAVGSGPKCNKIPPTQVASPTRGDHGFAVVIAGSPRLYRPGQVYTVTLEGVREDEGVKVKYIDFMIVAESNLPSTEVSGLGTFQLMLGDAMTKFSHRCSHAVEATSALNKEEVSVVWTAPPIGSGCIMLKAMVVERNDFWFMDDGALTYHICEDDSPMATPPVVEPCTACDEAKYEVIFEGLWSRHTHPKDFPRDEWQTQFSHMIGASHSIDYDLWKYGEIATPAMALLAENGDTKKLEIDMKSSSHNIRSVIKARGLQQRSNVVGRTFAVFRMDATKHLLSLISKIIPSPDWIVGVSMENLCLANGSWVDSRVVDLYPWDAGTNSGLGYHDHGNLTIPREAIHRITSCNPDNDASPFYDPTCAPVKPVARLHILKQREYKKQCPDGHLDPASLQNPSWRAPNGPGRDSISDVYGTGVGPNLGGEDSYDDDYGDGNYGDSPRQTSPRSSYSSPRDSSFCTVTDWTSWTACSQTCDRGSQSRSRSYPNPTGAQIHACDVNLLEKRVCNSKRKCKDKTYGGGFDPFFSTDELVSGYSSPWSRRGLSSQSLTEEQAEPKSYLYEGRRASPQVGSPSSYSQISSTIDPYSDPFNQLSGYEKQKGYPPKTNHPSSPKYNPYKEMGYYGYTYGGPPTGSLRQQSSYQEMGDQETLGEDLEEASPAPQSCETTAWGDWSDCSTACGTGTRTRTRRYVEQQSSSCSADLLQTGQCEQRTGCIRSTVAPQPRRRMTSTSTTSRPSTTTSQPRLLRRPTGRRLPGAMRQVGRRRKLQAGDRECDVAAWTEWSPCSVTCGHGYKIRTRVYTMPFVPNRSCDNTRLTQKEDCRMATCWNSRLYDGHDDSGVRTDIRDTSQGSEDSGPITLTIVEQPRHTFCMLEPAPGACKVSTEQWFYNATEATCARFMYSGCGGNKNNFNTETECMSSCHPEHTRRQRFRGLQSQSLTREGFLQDEAPRPEDCVTSPWSDWSACSTSCGRGWLTMERRVVAGPKNGGKACPRKLLKKNRCADTVPCPASPPAWYQSNWRMLEDRTVDN